MLGFQQVRVLHISLNVWISIIPEMENVNPDILFVPVSGTYVMTAKEAGTATNELIKPKKIAIPMHYGSIVGKVKDAEDICKDVNICKNSILEIE